MAGLSNKQRAFCEFYLRSWNASDAARRAGYTGAADVVGPRLLGNVGIAAAIKARLEELTMSETEVLTRLTEHARGDIGVMFKVIEEWTRHPLPTAEVIDAKEVTEPAEIDDETGKILKPSKTYIVYWVRQIVIDMDKFVQPEYSHLVHSFKDSPQNGVSFELYDAQNALKLIGQKYGMFKDKVEMTGKDGGPIEFVEVVKDYGIRDAEDSGGEKS